ncbi:hypothetical protein A4X09_0g6098 [Tilletia walkeri]|uniref:DUF6604 domain-containing protein n=1 Tax=Tilletia walkeri TaxID=117179 RepID=A0A8X7N4G3_9BASI|nr:hypothetical protein A4X09_0g6098 [Tilletia walkeri]
MSAFDNYTVYKHDTHELSMWLAQNAIENGYPISNFKMKYQADPGAGANDASKVVKAGDKKKRSKAKFLQQIKQQQLQAASKSKSVGTGKKGSAAQTSTSVEIPKGKYAIKVAQYIGLANFVAERKVDVPDHLLHRLYRILFEAKEDISQTNATEPNQQKQNTNRFASLEILDQSNDDIDDKIEGDEDIGKDVGSATPLKSSTTSTAALVQFDVEQSIEEAVMSALAFFAAWVDMRTYVRNLWSEYLAGKSDLMTTSVTTNLAIEMLRRPHDELVSNTLPFFENLREKYPTCSNGLEVMLVHLFNAISSRSSKDHVPLTALASYRDVKAQDTVKQLIYETLCIPVYQVFKQVIVNPSRFPSPYKTDGFDETASIRAMPFFRWQQLEKLIFNSYADYLILHPHFAHSPWFIADGDEMAKSFFECIDRKETTLYAILAAAVFVDINIILGSRARDALIELAAGAQVMHDTLQLRAEKEPPHRGLDFPEWSKTMMDLEKPVQMCASSPMDMVTLMNNLRAPAADFGLTYPRMLMRRSPMRCGTLLHRLQLHHGELGRAGQMFGGKVPKTVGEAQTNILKMNKMPVNVLMALRRGDGDLPEKPGPMRKRIIAGARKTPLQEDTQITALFKARYIQNVKVTPLEVSNFEQLLIDIVNAEDDQARKRDDQPRDRTLRKLRPQHSPQCLLDTFQRVLWQEASQWRFDYFAQTPSASDSATPSVPMVGPASP